MGGIKPPGGPGKDADSRIRRRFALHGPLTGADAPTQAEREHLQARAALLTLTRTLCEEPAFWRDVDGVRAAIAGVDETADPVRVAHPAWTRARSYGVQGEDHSTLITVILLTAAREPTRHAATAALLRLGEHPVALGDESRGNARHDVTRIVQGAQMIAAYRAGRCGAPGCRQPRQRTAPKRDRYCRRHADQHALHRKLKDARQWALEHAADALRAPDRILPGVDYAMLLIRSKAELDDG